MDDLNFEELSRQMSMDAIDDALKEKLKINPEAVAYFLMGRMVGRADITAMLLQIVEQETKTLIEWEKLTKGKKHG